jgi:hypothetical protein
MRRRGVSPRVSKRSEACSFFPDRSQQVQEIARGSRQAIESCNDQYVPFSEDRHQTHQLLAVRPSATDFLLKYLGAFRGFEFG